MRKTLLKGKDKGIALLLVITSLLIVVILASIVLNIILNQTRLTHHQLSRLQAYYAAEAGVRYAYEKLRNSSWSTGNYTICASGCDVTETQLPVSVDRVNVRIYAPGTGINQTRIISASVNYTYTVP